MGNRFSSTLSNLDDADIDQLLASLSLRFDRYNYKGRFTSQIQCRSPTDPSTGYLLTLLCKQRSTANRLNPPASSPNGTPSPSTATAVADVQIARTLDSLRRDYERIEECPNVMQPTSIGESDSFAYIVRPALHCTLADRLWYPGIAVPVCRMQPELSEGAKRWIVFQLLHTASLLHRHGVSHGHLCPENVSLTPSNWLLLTDLGGFRPFSITSTADTASIEHHSLTATEFYQLYYAREFGGLDGDACFIAPEQLHATKATKDVDVFEARKRADAYSIGMMICAIYGVAVPAFRQTIRPDTLALSIERAVAALSEEDGIRALVHRLLIERSIPEGGLDLGKTLSIAYDYMRALPVHQPHYSAPASAVGMTIAMLHRMDKPDQFDGVLVDLLTRQLIPQARTMGERLKAIALLPKYNYRAYTESAQVLLGLLADECELVRLAALCLLPPLELGQGTLVASMMQDPCDMLRREFAALHSLQPFDAAKGEEQIMQMLSDPVMRRALPECIFRDADDLHISVVERVAEQRLIDPVVFEEYYLPAILRAILHPSPLVIYKWLTALARLLPPTLTNGVDTDGRAVSMHAFYEALPRIVPLLVHPIGAVRDACWSFVDTLARAGSKRHVVACIMPALSGLSTRPGCFSRSVIIEPVEKEVYEEAIRAYILLNGSTFEMPQLVLLEPWIQSAASYGLLGDKQHRAAQAKGDQMVFLRDLGIVVEDECVGDTTASVPDVLAHLADKPVAGRSWLDWRLCGRLARLLARPMKRMLVSPDRQWLVTVEGCSLAFWDCRRLADSDAGAVVHVLELGELIEDVCFCEASLDLLVSTAMRASKRHGTTMHWIGVEAVMTDRLQLAAHCRRAYAVDDAVERGNEFDEDEQVLCMHHLHTGNRSMVVRWTNHRRLIGYDQRGQTTLWTLAVEIPDSDAMADAVCFCDSIAAVATQAGEIGLVDLRLGLVRKQLVLPRDAVADCLLLTRSTNSRGPLAYDLWVAVAGQVDRFSFTAGSFLDPHRQLLDAANMPGLRLGSSNRRAVSMGTAGEDTLVVSCTDGAVCLVKTNADSSQPCILNYRRCRLHMNGDIDDAGAGSDGSTSDDQIVCSRPKEGCLVVLSYPSPLLLSGHWDGRLCIWQ